MRKVLTAAAFLVFGAGSLGAQEQPGGPTQLLITYRCFPPRRVAFRQYMRETGIQRFEHWKQDGLLKNYRFLFNSYVDVDTWDAMAVLSFPSYTEVSRWKEVEKTNPGGLSRDALDLALPLNTYSADLAWNGASEDPQDPVRSVYVVIPYDYTSLPEYKDYANAYEIPQAKGWIREGVLASYNIYLNRYPSGKPWDVLFILEYKDTDAFARRDEVIAKVQAQLRSTPAWKAVSESKQKPRTEREIVQAEALVAH